MPLRPMIVRHHVIQLNSLIFHQPSNQRRRPINRRSLLTSIPKLTNLHPNARGVPRPLVICMLPLNV